MSKTLASLLRDEEGLTIVEYAIAGGVIAATVATAFTNLGAKVLAIITSLAGYIP